MSALNISFQTNLIYPETETVYINGSEAGEIESRGGYYLATSFCGKSANKDSKKEAVTFLLSFVTKEGKPVNQTKLF